MLAVNHGAGRLNSRLQYRYIGAALLNIVSTDETRRNYVTK